MSNAFSPNFTISKNLTKPKKFLIFTLVLIFISLVRTLLSFFISNTSELDTYASWYFVLLILYFVLPTKNKYWSETDNKKNSNRVGIL